MLGPVVTSGMVSVSAAAVYGVALSDATVYGLTITDTDARTGVTPVAYDIGDVVRYSAAFTNNAGAAADPTAVKLKLLSPLGNRIDLTYAAGEVQKDSTGNYHYDLTLTEDGDWWYKYEGTGAIIAAEEDYITVVETRF